MHGKEKDINSIVAVFSEVLGWATSAVTILGELSVNSHSCHCFFLFFLVCLFFVLGSAKVVPWHQLFL